MLMKRRIVAIILFFLAAELVIAAPVLAFTPFGTRLLHDLIPPPPPPPTPILTVRGTPPAVSAKAAYLLDADTGHVLVDVQGEQRLPMASTTKIMTALIAIQTADLSQIVSVRQDAINEVRTHNGSSAQLVVGDQIRLKDLLYGLMLPSGDDAAIAIADAIGGTTSKFVQTMNLYAHQLHLTQTHFINPDGLTYMTPQGQPDPNQYTTAADLAHLARAAMANPFFAQLVELQHFVLPASAVHHAYIWDSIDTLLSTYPGATGIKTGFTAEAGYCLVFAATTGGHHLLGVLLHEPDADQRFVDAHTLLDWGFALPLVAPAS
ncbi:MAG TPA: D-alanyl-D-alanine carboxypeptidase [Ktedonobacter sp.]|nr:D-alanyl-D-alanine carboxypeptidase [Ktedonobacter sp.]HAT44165.1 D-alanyl-D-alanine carboxypeptidase [Ktedonobacter sp.]HCJ34198.1 D-alanyl-D-alanine carboxypeptidase [Ktedonobacter sp.]